jgi:hypothetical protein
VGPAATRRSRLRQIVLVGFSAGGQTIHRYAWATSYGTPPPTPPATDGTTSSRRGPPAIKFVVSDPSSYLYFDSRRPAPSCRPLNDTGPSWKCRRFPRYTNATAQCDEFNNWKFGVRNVTTAIPYFTYTRPGVRTSQLGQAYIRKNILYVLGEADACNCGVVGYVNPDQCIRPPAEGSSGCGPSVVGSSCCGAPAPSRTNNLAVDCGAMMQVGE